MEDEQIRKIVAYYEDRVAQYGTSGKTTLLDENERLLEIDTVRSWLTPEDRVLDICCGHGVSTLQFAKACQSIVGLDLSEKMIATARRLLNEGASPPRNVSFEVGDVLDLPQRYPGGHFNAVVSVRGLINLPSWELQQRAILNVRRILPPGGKFIFIECSRDGLQTINEFRQKFSLPLIRQPWYDNHFDTLQVLEFVKQHFAIRENRNLDVYFLISRVFYPAVAWPEEPRFDHLCNTVARLIVPYVRADTNTTLLISKLFIKKG